MKYPKCVLSIVILMTIVLCSSHARAVELITNGSFETGNFTGWTAVNGAGTWVPWHVVTAGYSNGFSAPASPQHGTRVALHGVTGNAGATFTLTQDVTIPPASTASLHWRHRFQMDHLTFCGSCGTATFAVEVLNTSNVLLDTFYSDTVGSGVYRDTGWLIYNRTMTQYAGQTIRLRFRTHASATLQGPGQLELDAISVQTPSILPPTAAQASVSGRVINSGGDGLANISLFLSGPDGEVRSARSNQLGYFTFEGVGVGHTYLLSAFSKAHTFESRTVQVTDDVTDLNVEANRP